MCPVTGLASNELTDEPAMPHGCVQGSDRIFLDIRPLAVPVDIQWIEAMPVRHAPDRWLEFQTNNIGRLL